MKFVIRGARPEDLPALLEIEHQSFPSARWKSDDFLQNDCFVAEFHGRIIGFLVSREVFAGDSENPPEREILNVAVEPGSRRLGAATALILEEVQRTRDIFLEVRESNKNAQELYRKMGFVEVVRRPKYYQSPVETAIVMKMKWC